MQPRRYIETLAVDELVVSSTVNRIRLTPKMLRELRLALLAYTSPFTIELELIEEHYENDDVVVRLGRPEKPEDGELILGTRIGKREQQDSLLVEEAD